MNGIKGGSLVSGLIRFGYRDYSPVSICLELARDMSGDAVLMLWLVVVTLESLRFSNKCVYVDMIMYI
jgi:hypothetical protein